MTDIGDVCRKLLFFKQILLSNESSVDYNISVCGPKSRLSNSDNICNLVTKIFEETQNTQCDVPILNFQSEPLDLSHKQNSLESLPLPKRLWKPKTFDFDNFFTTHIKRFTANDVCNSRCKMLYKDHYHCFAENGQCSDVLKGKDQLRQHGRRHSIAEELTNVEYKFCIGCSTKDNDSHYHCSQNNCRYISIHSSNMDRLKHFEATHCVIISKRTNNHNNVSTQFCSTKRRRKTQYNNDDCCVVNRLQGSELTNHISPPISCDNQFIDFNPETVINTVFNDNLLRETHNINGTIDNALLLSIQEQEKNFYTNGCCSRLFCNLKKGDHYHCPICDRGSSKKELYVRHLKQRHK